MTLHILGIDKDDELPNPLQQSVQDDRVGGHTGRLMSAYPSDQFWTSAGDLLIDIVRTQPKFGQAVDTVIAAGGDVEITAHNAPDSITVTLVTTSGMRQVLFDNRSAIIATKRPSALNF